MGAVTMERGDDDRNLAFNKRSVGVLVVFCAVALFAVVLVHKEELVPQNEVDEVNNFVSKPEPGIRLANDAVGVVAESTMSKHTSQDGIAQDGTAVHLSVEMSPKKRSSGPGSMLLQTKAPTKIKADLHSADTFLNKWR